MEYKFIICNGIGFERAMNRLLGDGWRPVPGTLGAVSLEQEEGRFERSFWAVLERQPAASADPHEIVVEVRGGVVQAVHGETDDVTVTVVDWDARLACEYCDLEGETLSHVDGAWRVVCGHHRLGRDREAREIFGDTVRAVRCMTCAALPTQPHLVYDERGEARVFYLCEQCGDAFDVGLGYKS